MKKIRLAINGFGRIGRAAFKIALDHDDIEVVAINDLGKPDFAAYLFKYDTAYGTYPKNVSATANGMVIDGKEYPMYAIKGLESLPWAKHEVDVVLECTGVFTTAEDAKKHLISGAKAVVISAPSKGEDPVPTYVLGVNEDAMKSGSDVVISNASCTTNCIAPVMHLMQKKFGIKKSLMTTVHAYTASQAVVDGGKAKDWREARAAAMNIIPTSTGAAKATTLTIPELKGKFDGISMRVPVAVGSISDITMVTEKTTSVEEVNELFRTEAKNPRYKNILAASDEKLVSSDIVGTVYSAIVDLSMTRVIDGDLVKVVAWYDNEWGYSNRLIEMAAALGRK